jgi:hypothetical protein
VGSNPTLSADAARLRAGRFRVCRRPVSGSDAVDTDCQEVVTVPRGRSHGPSVKNPRQYEKMRSSGIGKSKAARISNAGKGALRKGGKQPPYDDWSKQDLMKRARDLDIAGRSSMNKGQLIRALRSTR